MKMSLVALCLIALCACKVQKTGPDTYKVVAPTPQAKAAGEKAKVEAARDAQKLKEGAARLAQKVGAELQQAGAKVESHTSTETTETTSTTTTETRTHVSHRH